MFKQATHGHNDTPQPSRLKMVDYAKWSAWKEYDKMSKADAQNEYVKRLNEVAPKWDDPRPKL